MFEISTQVAQSHIDENGKLSLYAAMDFMQDCSFFQVNAEKALIEEFEKHNMGMFLISRQVNVLRMPLFGERLKVRTWVYELNNVFGFRNTVIYNEHGKACVVSYAGGAFVQLDSGKPSTISDETKNNILVEEKLDMTYLPRKIRIPIAEYAIEAAPVEVLKSHLDSYKHMNNSKYVMLALEYLPEGYTPSQLRIEYKIPAKYGDTIYPVIYRSGENFIVSLNDANKRQFAVIDFLLN